MVNLKLVVYDFDGVLTDNRVWVSQDGIESVACNRSDGWWIGEIRKTGVEQIILSTEKNPVVSARAQKLKLEVHQGIADKKSALIEITKSKGIPLENVCYIGNDMNDAGCLSIVGFPMCPQDSHPEVLKLAKHVLPANGGAGIVPHLFSWMQKPATPTPTSRTTNPGHWQDKIKSTMRESIQVKEALLDSSENLALLEQMGLASAQALKNGKKILFAGNGGSFADSMHLAAEFVSKLARDRMPLPALALGAANSNLTAIGNDYGYEHVFSREIYALGNPGDVLFAISTSGNSPNVLAAIRAAKEKQMTVFGWSGLTGGKIAGECPTIKVPSKDTARIQECHILIGHLLCEIAEDPFLSMERAPAPLDTDRSFI